MHVSTLHVCPYAEFTISGRNVHTHMCVHLYNNISLMIVCEHHLCLYSGLLEQLLFAQKCL